MSILYITHDLATAYQVSDEIFILHRGRIVERGPTRSVIDAPVDPVHAPAHRLRSRARPGRALGTPA